MCPSYMVTREEKHCTRGRAHLLFEMMNGEVLTDGWRSEAVKDALDLCLACKGCKHDCPVNVDMATYKAEFLSHYYEGRLRPRHAYSMGFIHRWARLASRRSGRRQLLQPDAGPERGRQVARRASPRSGTMPPFARETFKDWFFAAGAQRRSGRPVILWADTFNNYFQPEHGKAAVEVLEDAGLPGVRAPRRTSAAAGRCTTSACSTRAKSYLRNILTTLQPVIEAGVPVVGLEPSCTAVFRDELVELFAGNEDAKRLHDQTFYLSEFLNRHADG